MPLRLLNSRTCFCTSHRQVLLSLNWFQLFQSLNQTSAVCQLSTNASILQQRTCNHVVKYGKKGKLQVSPLWFDLVTESCSQVWFAPTYKLYHQKRWMPPAQSSSPVLAVFLAPLYSLSRISQSRKCGMRHLHWLTIETQFQVYQQKKD